VTAGLTFRQPVERRLPRNRRIGLPPRTDTGFSGLRPRCL